MGREMRGLWSLGLLLTVVALALITIPLPAATAASSASSAPLLTLSSPFGPGLVVNQSSGPSGWSGTRGCNSHFGLSAAPSFDQVAGKLNFSAFVNLNLTNLSEPKCHVLDPGFSGLSYYMGDNFTSRWSGLHVIRAYWQLGWGFSYSMTELSSRQACYLNEFVQFEFGVVDLNLSSNVASTTAGFYNQDQTCNSTAMVNGPGDISMPLVTALTHHHVYQFYIEVTEALSVSVRYPGNAHAILSLDGGGGTRLKDITIR